MNEERIQKVFSDEEFVKELLNKETPEEVQALLADKDIDLSIDEIVKLKEVLEKKSQQADAGEELGDDDLEDVSGGIGIVAAIVITCVASTVVAGGFIAANASTRGRW